MGQGDPKFLAAIGAWVPTESLPIILLSASISGLVYAVYLKALKKDNSTVPFGPFLAFGAIIAYLIPTQQFYQLLN
jgi:leader peptidase (prepilin peptidase)/N-methyltransferase